MTRATFLAAVLLAACSDSSGASIGSERTAELCSDRLDNDDDGFIDCDDQDCWGLVACAPPGVGDVSDDASTALPGDADTARDGEDDVPPGPGCQPCGTGQVRGRVCAPNEQTFVNDAEVQVQGVGCEGQPFVLETRSDADGTYLFDEVPCGQHQITITKGSFSRQQGVLVEAGETTDLASAAQKLCFGATTTPIAVLEGNWDDIEGLLGQLGLDFHRYSQDGAGAEGTIVELLSDPSRMAAYDIIFANCGAYHGWMPQDFPAVMPNVKAFVLAGGSFYMSDYAWVYGEWSFPDAIEFQGSDDVMDMYTGASPQWIGSGQTATGTILDGAMASLLGKSELDITFDQGPQIAPKAPGPGTFVHVHGSGLNPLDIDHPLPGDVPLVLSYVPAPGAGRVIYTNFHNDAQTTRDMLDILSYLVFTL